VIGSGPAHTTPQPRTPTYADVRPTLLQHTEAVSTRYGTRVRSLLVEAGRRGAIGGREDKRTDVALTPLTVQESQEATA
jgi:4-hydroxy 2-oxovalerate aldolase